MKMKKLIALLLVISMVAVLFAACANNDSDGGTYTRPPSDKETPDDQFVSADYDKQDFTFLYIKHTDIGKDYYGGPYLDADTYNGDKINDAVYERNMAVEERYNVNITTRNEVNGDPGALLQQFYMAGDFNYDVIYGWGYKLGACITDNYFANFYDLKNTDFTQDYWSPSAMDDLTIDGKLYLCTNDISMNKLQWAGFIFFNKKLMEDYNLEKEFGNLYDLVRDGKWTLDTFLAMVSSMGIDLDGNGTVGNNDVFGLIDGNAIGSGMSNACGVFNTARNDDGTYSLTLWSDKVLNIIEKVNRVYSDTKYVKSYATIWDAGEVPDGMDQWEYARSFFATDHALFCGGSAYITDEFRNMESPYGIVPNPKYDENQQSYYSTVDCLSSIFAIPSTKRSDMSTAGLERTGTILEYMAYKSNEILLPSYYEEVLGNQRLTDDNDKEMMDLIRSTIRYEFSDMMNLESISETKSTLYEKPGTAASTYTRSERRMLKELNDFYIEFLQMVAKNESAG